MKHSSNQSTPAVLTNFHKFFHKEFLSKAWDEAAPGKYKRKIMGPALVEAIMRAMLSRMTGVRDIVNRCGELLGTSNFSSLSYALGGASGVRLLLTMIAAIGANRVYKKGELIALDSMALVIGKTRKHNCVKYNDNTVGGGVLWSYRIKTRNGSCPVKLLKLIRGSWNDSTFMRGVKLLSDGPVYLMDRGFYSIENIGFWLKQKVRFIIRVRRTKLQYDIVRHVSDKCLLNNGWRLELDALVSLGSPNRKSPRPTVRLIIAYNPKGEQFIFATGEQSKSAQEIADNYKKRWHIERFHRYLKDNIGLAHIYSYDATGMEFMLLTALLTAMLLFTTVDPNDDQETILLLLAALKQTRKQLGIRPVWRRNILSKKRGKKTKAKN